jgi:hypothetical protein
MEAAFVQQLKIKDKVYVMVLVVVSDYNKKYKVKIKPIQGAYKK